MQGLPEIANGVLIGLGAAVPIGPVNVEIARRTLRSGWAAGVAAVDDCRESPDL